MNYIKYTRSFVMMEEQTADFATSKGPAKGYLKIETGNNKGALRCVVQNLKYFSRGEYIYKLIFFGKKGDRVLNVVLGSLAINRNGNGETYFRFNPLDMDGKGSSFDDYSIALVAAASGKDSKEALQAVLKGILQESDVKESEILGEDPIEDSIEDPAEELAAERISYNGFYNNYLLQFCRYTCRMANYYEDVFPFGKDSTNARWKKILNIASLPIVSPGAHFFASRYGHFLFGARPDPEGKAKCYYFAVPGRFIQEEQPDGGASGFVFWQPVAGASQDENEKAPDNLGYGYWIVAIDVMTGDIIEAG